MKIGIDLLPLKTYNFTRGIGKYSFDVVKNIIQIDSTNQFFLFNVPQDLSHNFEQNNVIYFTREATVSDTDNLDLFIFLSLFELDYDISPNPLDIHCKKGVIIYDLIPILFWDHYIPFFPKNSRSRYFTGLASIQHFDIIFTISATTKNDLIDLLEIPSEKITVIYCGLNEDYLKEKSDHQTIQKIKSKYGIQRKFLLSTPGFDFRKNVFGIFQAFSYLPLNVLQVLDLVVVCKLNARQKQILLNIWTLLNLPTDHLILTNYIPAEDLIVLYDGAELFVFPSFYEGFGIPVLEAMSRGCPVVTSDGSSLPEVCESAAILVNPYDSQEISSAIKEILNNEYVRKKLVTLGLEQYKKFSWKNVVYRILNVFEELSRNSPKNMQLIGTHRHKIAFFTPLNPIKSGISDYSEELLVSLSSRYDIDIFIASDYSPDNTQIIESFRIFPYTLFESKKYQYDLCVYQVGNSKFHSFMFENLMKYPGIVILHDAILPYLIESICIDKKRKTFNYLQYFEYVFNNHGYKKYIDSVNGHAQHIPIDHYDFSLHFLKKIVDQNIRILVHNEFSKKFVENNISFSNVRRITMGVSSPQHLTIDKESVKKEFNLNNLTIISAFGRITKTKRIDILLSSFSEIVRDHKINNVHLLLVGSVDPSLKTEIENLISLKKIDKLITITGFIPYDDLNKYYAMTDICVNLRYPTSGETSSTLVTALMHGLPVITSNIAQYQEYPDNCVWKVDVDVNEIDTLTAFLLELIKNRELRKAMSNNSIKYAEEFHSASKMLSEYVSIIDYTLNSMIKFPE